MVAIIEFCLLIMGVKTFIELVEVMNRVRGKEEVKGHVLEFNIRKLTSLEISKFIVFRLELFLKYRISKTSCAMKEH